MIENLKEAFADATNVFIRVLYYVQSTRNQRGEITDHLFKSLRTVKNSQHHSHVFCTHMFGQRTCVCGQEQHGWCDLERSGTRVNLAV